MKAIRKTNKGFAIGVAQFGRYGQGRGTVSQQMHDGDTATVELVGNLGVRLLSVDAAGDQLHPPADGHRGD